MKDLWTYKLILLSPLTILSVVVGLLMGNKYILPLLNGVVLYPYLLHYLKNDQRRQAIYTVTIWGLTLIVFISMFTIYNTEISKNVIIESEKYEREMVQNIVNPKTSNSLNPLVFIISQNRLLIIYLILALLSAGMLSAFYGAYLLNFMGYYIGTLFVKSSNVIAWSMGFHPWSVFRAIAFILLGILSSEIGFSFYTRKQLRVRGSGKLLIISFISILLDILSKTYFGVFWYETMKKFL